MMVMQQKHIRTYTQLFLVFLYGWMDGPQGVTKSVVYMSTGSCILDNYV